MKLSRSNIIIGLAVLGLLTFIFWASGSGTEKVSWIETYDEESRQPYGAFLTKELLDSYFPKHRVKVVKDSIGAHLSKENANGNYVFIGESMLMNKGNRESLIEFVKKGNQAFIAAKIPPKDLIDSLLTSYCEEELYLWGVDYYTYDTLARFDFAHQNLTYRDTTYQFKYEEEFDTRTYRWSYVPYFLFCEENFSMLDLGLMNDTLVNHFQIKIGEGYFYFHTNPILFSNHAQISDGGQDYANRVFAHLEEGDIYWDRKSRVPFDWDDDWWLDQKRTFSSDGPLKYVLAQPSLAWAWYILLAMGLLYLLFRAKRQQRIIPVLAENRNTSLAFITTIGRMYFLQQNHRKIALQKIRLWKGFVRERYKISTKELNEQFVNQLANKSNFPKTDIERILTISMNIEKSGFLSENSLIDFHELLDRFYKNSK